MPLIRFLPFNLDLQSFLNLPIYSTVVLPFMHLGNDHERPVQLKKSRCLAVALFLNFPGALVIWWVHSTAIHIPYSFSFFSFSWQHTCLTQRTSSFPLRKSLPLEQVSQDGLFFLALFNLKSSMNNTWLMGFMSFVSLYQALIFRNTWVGVNVISINSKGDKESPWMIPRINFMFLGNCPPTPLLSQHFALSEQ